MNEILRFFTGLLAAVVRAALWLVTAVLALGLLALALVLLLLGVLWALVRGRRPQAPVFVGRFRQFTSQRVWPGGAPWHTGARAEAQDVVDVEVREVAPEGEPRGAHPRSTDALEDRRSD
jgi:hypothetical protein